MILTVIHFPGEAFAQRVTQTRRYGNESRHSGKAERHDVSQNLYSTTRKCQVCIRNISMISAKE